MDTGLKIIVVEDHDALREVTVAALQSQGHLVRGVDCAEALDDELAEFGADLLVLDLNLPGEDGISLARRIRAADSNIGIIMLTARGSTRDIEAGYDAGADIYLAKPTSPEELAAAVRGLSRRLRSGESVEGKLVLNPSALQLIGPMGVVDVSNLDCKLLESLAKAQGHRLETWQLLERLGKQADEQERRALAVQIVRLRKKLAETGAREPTLKAIRGTGYQLCVDLKVRRSLPG